MSTLPSFKLNTGASIPAIGLGAFAGVTPEEQAAASSWFLTAINSGYRHLDTAWIYGTEKSLGQAIKESGVPREELFVTTKLPWHHLSRVEISIDQSLKNLGLDYIDLYLLHWPQAVAYLGDDQPIPRNPDGSLKVVDTPTFHEAWAQMEKVLASGKVKAIGVSNFSIKTLDELFETAKIIPAVNQVEMHPHLAQNELLEYCRKKGIQIAAYTPTGYAQVRDDPTIIELGAKYKVSPAQIILAWHVSRGVVAVPKSSNEERQRDNINLPKLDAEDLKRIDSLDRNDRVCNKADEKTGLIWGWSYEQLGW